MRSLISIVEFANQNESIVDEPITDIEFINKRELYNNYGIIKTIPDGYEVKIRHKLVNK